MEEKLKQKCMNEDFDILHKCVKAYNHDVLDILNIKNWNEQDTRDFLDTDDKLFWTLYSCVIETKIKYKIANLN